MLGVVDVWRATNGKGDQGTNSMSLEGDGDVEGGMLRSMFFHDGSINFFTSRREAGTQTTSTVSFSIGWPAVC